MTCSHCRARRQHRRATPRGPTCGRRQSRRLLYVNVATLWAWSLEATFEAHVFRFLSFTKPSQTTLWELWNAPTGSPTMDSRFVAPHRAIGFVVGARTHTTREQQQQQQQQESHHVRQRGRLAVPEPGGHPPARVVDRLPPDRLPAPALQRAPLLRYPATRSQARAGY